MRKAVGKSETPKNVCRTDPNGVRGDPVSTLDRSSPVHLDETSNRRTDRSSPEGSHCFNGELYMRNRLQLSFWGLRIDAVGVFAIVVSLLIVSMFTLLLALRF
jgi:hypothetical protein